MYCWSLALLPQNYMRPHSMMSPWCPRCGSVALQTDYASNYMLVAAKLLQHPLGYIWFPVTATINSPSYSQFQVLWFLRQCHAGLFRSLTHIWIMLPMCHWWPMGIEWYWMSWNRSVGSFAVLPKFRPIPQCQSLTLESRACDCGVPRPMRTSAWPNIIWKQATIPYQLSIISLNNAEQLLRNIPGAFGWMDCPSRTSWELNHSLKLKSLYSWLIVDETDKHRPCFRLSSQDSCMSLCQRGIQQFTIRDLKRQTGLVEHQAPWPNSAPVDGAGSMISLCCPRCLPVMRISGLAPACQEHCSEHKRFEESCSWSTFNSWVEKWHGSFFESTVIGCWFKGYCSEWSSWYFLVMDVVAQTNTHPLIWGWYDVLELCPTAQRFCQGRHLLFLGLAAWCPDQPKHIDQQRMVICSLKTSLSFSNHFWATLWTCKGTSPMHKNIIYKWRLCYPHPVAHPAVQPPSNQALRFPSIHGQKQLTLKGRAAKVSDASQGVEGDGHWLDYEGDIDDVDGGSKKHKMKRMNQKKEKEKKKERKKEKKKEKENKKRKK